MAPPAWQTEHWRPDGPPASVEIEAGVLDCKGVVCRRPAAADRLLSCDATVVGAKALRQCVRVCCAIEIQAGLGGLFAHTGKGALMAGATAARRA